MFDKSGIITKSKMTLHVNRSYNTKLQRILSNNEVLACQSFRAQSE